MIYDLKIYIELNKYTSQIINSTNEIIEEIIKTNIINLNNIPKIIPTKLENIIFQVRKGIPQCNKAKWYMIECSLDKFEQKVYKDILPNIKKKKQADQKKKITKKQTKWKPKQLVW